MNKMKKGDDVIVIAGKDKGKRGTVVNVGAKKVLVEGVNLVKKHTKANPMAGQQGGIVATEMPIQRSNIAMYNPATGKADRIGVKFLEDGTNVRIFKSNQEVVDL